MNEENEFGYFKGGLVIGASLGILSGVASTLWYQKNEQSILILF